MMELPNWALVVMFLSGLVGMFMLSREMIRRFA